MKLRNLRLLSIQWIMALALLTQASPSLAKSKIYTGFFNNEAVSGYDAVAYFTEKKAIEGRKKYKADYMGASWLFSNQNNLNLFKNNPEKYAPQYGGYCAWAVAQGDTASADPKQWSIEDGKLYLNYDAAVKKKWLVDKSNFIKKANDNWPTVLK